MDRAREFDRYDAWRQTVEWPARSDAWMVRAQIAFEESDELRERIAALEAEVERLASDVESHRHNHDAALDLLDAARDKVAALEATIDVLEGECSALENERDKALAEVERLRVVEKAARALTCNSVRAWEARIPVDQFDHLRSALRAGRSDHGQG